MREKYTLNNSICSIILEALSLQKAEFECSGCKKTSTLCDECSQEICRNAQEDAEERLKAEFEKERLQIQKQQEEFCRLSHMMIDALKLKKIKDFGISMAGKYRNQGMLEYAAELKQSLATLGKKEMKE